MLVEGLDQALELGYDQGRGLLGAWLSYAPQSNRGKRREIYYFRDQQGLEVDFIAPSGPGRLAFIEAKASQMLRPEMAGPILRLRASAAHHKVDCFVVCPGAGPAGHAGLVDGVRGMGIEGLAREVLGLRALWKSLAPSERCNVRSGSPARSLHLDRRATIAVPTEQASSWQFAGSARIRLLQATLELARRVPQRML